MKTNSQKNKPSDPKCLLSERIRFVMTGQVDHGKSSVIGRLMVEAGAVPDAKLEAVRVYCERNSRPFEYAFILDALSAERAQGVTIDAARILLRRGEREIAFVDAPGHVDFLRNMVTGASFADAAGLVVDAKEGIRENTKCHAALLSFLGVRQVALLVNKMDLVDYSQARFREIETEWNALAAELKLISLGAIPLSALANDNLVTHSERMPWYQGKALLSLLDLLQAAPSAEKEPLRMFVQDVYKFTKDGDDRRIIAGTILSGSMSVGDQLVFSPSGKKSTVRSIETFPLSSKTSAVAGESIGFTLEEPIFLTRGQLVSRVGEESPETATEVEAKVFWLGETPLAKAEQLKILIGSNAIDCSVQSISEVVKLFEGEVIPATALSKGESGTITFKLRTAASFDLFERSQLGSRFVLVRDWIIVGGGVVGRALKDEQKWLREKLRVRGEKWTHSSIDADQRAARFGQKPSLVFVTGSASSDRKRLARLLERTLFADGRNPYFLSFGNLLYGLDADIKDKPTDGTAAPLEHFRRLGESANILLDSGAILIVSVAELNKIELAVVREVLNFEEVLTVWLGTSGESDLNAADLLLPSEEDEVDAINQIIRLLEERGIID